jgi:hypothetical protein
VCRFLSHRDQQHVESAYQESLASNRSYNDSWSSDQGTRTVYVSHPNSEPNAGAHCKSVMATVADPHNGRQDLPPEVFCRNSHGQWIPQS